MVNGVSAHLMTDSYALLQTSQSRNPDLMQHSNFPQYFMDAFQENLFKTLWPDLYRAVENKSENLNDLIQRASDLPLSMKRVLLYQIKNEDSKYAPLHRTSREIIDPTCPMDYLFEGMWGRKKRAEKLFTRAPFSHAIERIPLDQRYRTSSTHEKPQCLLLKLPIKPLKYLDTVCDLTAILAYKNDISTKLRTNSLTSFEKMTLKKTLELIDILGYYADKNAGTGGQVPSPLYIFIQKCPELLQVYCDSPLRKWWHCPQLDKIASLEHQISILNHHEVNGSEEPIGIQQLHEMVSSSHIKRM